MTLQPMTVTRKKARTRMKSQAVNFSTHFLGLSIEVHQVTSDYFTWSVNPVGAPSGLQTGEAQNQESAIEQAIDYIRRKTGEGGIS